MQEIISGISMALDAFCLFLLLPNTKNKFLLACWTTILHIVFPFIGFWVGDYFYVIFGPFIKYVSIILLFCVGLQMLLVGEKKSKIVISPYILAISVSIDTFSVAISFGMLKLHKILFIISAAISTFVLTYLALSISSFKPKIHQKYLNRITGLILIGISIWSYVKLYFISTK